MSQPQNSFDAGLDVSKVIARQAEYNKSSNTAGSNSLGTWLALKDVLDHTVAEAYGFSRRLQDLSETALQNDPDASVVQSGLDSHVISVRDRWIRWTVKAAEFLPEGFDEAFVVSYVDNKRMSVTVGSTAALTGDNSTVEDTVEGEREGGAESDPAVTQLTATQLTVD
ncbi:hypothetical protein EHS25_003768 [Saitozyma podzolica]|uniref:Uncharacterized protein n=1 Tax=Saitozyma podzolica TaxID=1890683 RepID=A0A427Y3G3_9TREE|nr:hypothetical protein EHS25_003768 [Saitozyma podzolica]